MTPSKLGQATLQALKCLKPSGEKSFEKLTATLLSQLIGMSIRLCKSGYQGGIDALAEIPIAIEDKRSQAGTLDLNELRGKLAEAARIYPDLQLWVLTATVSLDPFNKHALEQTAELLGLGVLILDSATAQPELPDLAAIVALCASSPEETLKAIATQDWLDSQRVADMPAITEVQAELEAIRALPRFTEWLDRLRAKLIELPLWQLITNRQNRRLTQILEENAYIGFGTAFDSSTLVPRTVKSDLNAWFPTAMESSDHEIAVVLGERYDGKTWLVFGWLRDNLATLPVPVFFIGSKHGMNSVKNLGDHILDNIKQVLGSFECHAGAILRRQRDIKAGATPWCLIILDGLNEYGPNSDRWLEHLAWASGRMDLNVRPCVVLVTVRQRSWREFGGQIKGRVREIYIGPYDDTEFQAALRLQGLPADYLQSLPENAREMVRHPRYLGLVISHRDKLGRYDAVTPDVLNWLDACDKIARHRSAPASGWDEEHFQSDWELFQIALGARHQSQARLLRVVKVLLGNSDVEIRARAVRIAGWLEGMSAEIAEVERSDPSLWVRHVAELALESARLETWARHWLSTYINDASPEIRWGAGQLFLACVDSRVWVWAWPIVNQSGLVDRTRGETILLLDAAEQASKKKDQRLHETFLLHKVTDLRAVCHPWHPEVAWEDLLKAG